MRHKKDSSTEKANAKKRTSKLVNIQRYHIATYWSIYDLLINEITCKKCSDLDKLVQELVSDGSVRKQGNQYYVKK